MFLEVVTALALWMLLHSIGSLPKMTIYFRGESMMPAKKSEGAIYNCLSTASNDIHELNPVTPISPEYI